MSTTAAIATAIRPFSVEISQEQIDNLRRRIETTRWPTAELVEDASQGPQLAFLRELARYWAEDYDFGRLEARLNALPQFTTEIDGLAIHFIHVKSPHEGALTARRGGYGSQAPRWLPWQTLRRPLTWYWRLRGKMGGPGLV